jgi:serine phosphatase RsbU (regulator of sigma subunit)
VLTLCNAGHPPPIIYRAATGTWSLLENKPSDANRGPTNLPLGILDIADYDQLDIRLEVGDLVLLYTDSLIEAADANGQVLEPAGVLRILQSIPTKNGTLDAAVLIPKLLLAIASAHPNNLHDDDVTALLIRANGTAEKVSFKDKLLAPARVVKGIFASLLSGGKVMPLPEMSVKNIGGAIIDRLSQR